MNGPTPIDLTALENSFPPEIKDRTLIESRDRLLSAIRDYNGILDESERLENRIHRTSWEAVTLIFAPFGLASAIGLSLLKAIWH